jgi:hypothetical protein
MRFGQLKPCLDYLDIAFRRLDSLLGLLLEGMKDVDNAGEANGVDGAVSIAVLVIDDLEHIRPPNPFKALARGCSSPFCASLIANPMTRRTSSGNARKSSRDDPIHNAGFCIFIRRFYYSSTAIVVNGFAFHHDLISGSK